MDWHLLEHMAEHRHVGSNNFNLFSSRSHTIFTLVRFFYLFLASLVSFLVVYHIISLYNGLPFSSIFHEGIFCDILYGSFFSTAYMFAFPNFSPSCLMYAFCILVLTAFIPYTFYLSSISVMCQIFFSCHRWLKVVHMMTSMMGLYSCSWYVLSIIECGNLDCNNHI